MKVYIDGSYVIKEAHEPFLSNWQVMDAPEGIPIDELTVVNDKVVQKPKQTNVTRPAIDPDTNIIGHPVYLRSFERLALAQTPAPALDFKLMAMLSLGICLSLTGNRVLVKLIVSKIKEYLDAAPSASTAIGGSTGK